MASEHCGRERCLASRISSSDGRPDTAIDTKSGLVLDFADPDPSQISLEDIAAGLSMVCRFGGQALAFYSVAQHAVLVRRLVEQAGRSDLALSALHHDSHEAYACDIPAPLKRVIREAYKPVADRLDAAIAHALDLPVLSEEDDHVITECDHAAFEIEKEQLLNVGGRHTGRQPPTELFIDGTAWPLMAASQAEAEFLSHHRASHRHG